MQRSLGLGWDLATDTLTFRADGAEKPFTPRGVLSTINSLFDPLGFAAPFSVQGRLILTELTTETCDWDAPLPREKLEQWQRWCTSLQDLRELKIPRATQRSRSPQLRGRRSASFVMHLPKLLLLLLI